jgi:hypothetical protein
MLRIIQQTIQNKVINAQHAPKVAVHHGSPPTN